MFRMSLAVIVASCGALFAGGGYGHIQAARPSMGVQLVAAAQSPGSAVSLANQDHGAVLRRYCITCHNERVKSAGLLLDKMNVGDVSTDAEKWEKVVRKLRSGAMPPAGVPRPDEATYEALATRLERDLDRAAADSRNPGRVAAFRRLTRTEYRNAVRDLLALTELPKGLDLAVLLPADNSTTGFDNLADLLFVSST